jgi:hypothetical protein
MTRRIRSRAGCPMVCSSTAVCSTDDIFVIMNVFYRLPNCMLSVLCHWIPCMLSKDRIAAGTRVASPHPAAPSAVALGPLPKDLSLEVNQGSATMAAGSGLAVADRLQMGPSARSRKRTRSRLIRS